MRVAHMHATCKLVAFEPPCMQCTPIPAAAAKIAKLGFTMKMLLNMKDEELKEMMNSLSQIFRWDLLVRER